MFWKKSADAVRIDKLEFDKACLSVTLAERDATIKSHRLEIEDLRESAYGADRTAAMYKRLYENACDTLVEIAALETPACASIGKRMARIARAGLPITYYREGAHVTPNKPADTGVAVPH